VTDEKYRKFEGYAAEIFSAFGLDLNSPALGIHRAGSSKLYMAPSKAMMATPKC
jgi:hypothetical protein